tara:strand:- start:3716 stop:4114 length:399 start_codon:yes stop_codon:yes gene_type:complete
MAHYSFLDENNIVVEVLVGIDENDTSELPEGYDSWESYYSFIKGATCKRTSYNTINNEHLLGGVAFRGNYAGVGSIYDEANDVFYRPQPYESWVLDETTWTWQAPIDYPADADGNIGYIWNEETQSWDLVNE